MSLVKTSVVLQSEGDVDALLLKRGATVKAKFGPRGYDIDVQATGLLLVTWDTALGPTPTQAEIDALNTGDRTAGTTAARMAILKTISRTNDRLADFALMHRIVDSATWDKMVDDQKLATVLADADAWLAVHSVVVAP